MRIKDICISNYKKINDINLNFDENMTVLAGANNAGKTSIINFLKEIFNDGKKDCFERDIPASDADEWANSIIGRLIELRDEDDNSKIVEELVDIFKNTTLSTPELKMHLTYKKEDDIFVFSDYIMDLNDKKMDFYFYYCFELDVDDLIKNINREYNYIINYCKSDTNDKVSDSKINHLKEYILKIYLSSCKAVCYYCNENYDKFDNCKFKDINEFKKLFNFCFIKASRPLDDNSNDKEHLLTKEMVKTVRNKDEWNAKLNELSDSIYKDVIELNIEEQIRNASANILNQTIKEINKNGGGNSSSLLIDTQITKDNITQFINSITSAKYCVNDYYMDESSQGLGFSNLVYIVLQLHAFKELIKDDCYKKVNCYFIEEPESHMHPQMQNVFIKYLKKYFKDEYNNGLQGLVTTHSNEMVKAIGLKPLRVLRATEDGCRLYDLNQIKSDIQKNDSEDDVIETFFNFFFEVGYSEIVFADKVVLYEGDSERLYIRKLITLREFEELQYNFIAFIQVGGNYAHLFKKLTDKLNIKTLILTDIDYAKDVTSKEKILKSKSTNSTINLLFKEENNTSKNPTVDDLYKFKYEKGNCRLCYQTDKDHLGRTLEEAMICKLFDINATEGLKKSEWEKKRAEYNLKYSIPTKVEEKDPESGEYIIYVRDILNSTSGGKVDFMYSVILNDLSIEMLPNYIKEGLSWLKEK